MAPERLVSTEFAGLTTVPVSAVRARLDAAGELSEPKQVVLDWFEALSDGRLDDAYALMNPEGSYWVLRQRTTVSNARFAETFTNAYKNNFSDGIVFTIGAMTAEAGQVAVVCEGHAVLSATGEPYENMYHYLLTVDRGLIQDVCEFADTYRSAQAFAPPGSS
jgi:ketosteroid isomerase-like protein